MQNSLQTINFLHVESGSRHYTLPLLFYRLFNVPLSLLWGPRHLFECFDIHQFLLLKTILNFSFAIKGSPQHKSILFTSAGRTAFWDHDQWSMFTIVTLLSFVLERHVWSVAPLMLLNLSWHFLFSNVYSWSLMSSIPKKVPWSNWIIINAVCRYIGGG